MTLMSSRYIFKQRMLPTHVLVACAVPTLHTTRNFYAQDSSRQTGTVLQAGQPIPGYFSGNGNFHYKTYEIQRNQTLKMGENTFATPSREVHLKYQLRTLAQGTVGLQILENRQNGDQKAGVFRVKYG